MRRTMAWKLSLVMLAGAGVASCNLALGLNPYFDGAGGTSSTSNASTSSGTRPGWWWRRWQQRGWGGRLDPQARHGLVGILLRHAGHGRGQRHGRGLGRACVLDWEDGGGRQFHLCQRGEAAASSWVEDT